ncbi:MAG: T9SS type A sorting domain-containing protein [Candidatus Kapaibacterium sp.]
MKKLILFILIITTALHSAEIIPIWNKESGAGDIQDMELLKGGDQFIILAGEGPEAQIQIRNTEGGELVSSFTTPISTGSKLQITPDSTRILVVNGSYAQLRNLDSDYSIVTTYHIESDSIKLIFNDLTIDPIRPIAYLAAYGGQYINGKYQSASKILAYNYESGEHIIDLTGLGEYEYQVIDVSDDGKYLATINEGKAYLKVWDLETMELIRNVQLYDDKLPNDWWCEALQIEFSSINANIIFLSGLFTKKINELRTSGVFKFDLLLNELDRLAPDGFYGGGKFAFFNLETNVIVPRSFSFAILNLSSNTIEYISKPKEGIFADEKVIYILNKGSFIGYSENNMSKFSYDSESNIEKNIDELIIISPNPTSSIVNLSLDCVDEKTSYTITNQSGQVVGKKAIPFSSNSLQIDFSPFPSGVYFLTVYYGKDVKTYKVVREG